MRALRLREQGRLWYNKSGFLRERKTEEKFIGRDERRTAMEAEKKALVTRDMLVGEIISKYPDAAFALMQCGMGCISCPASQAETLSDASMVHGMNADEVVDYVNEYLAFQAENAEKQ